MNIFQQVALYIYSLLLAVIPMPKYVEGVVGQPQSFLPTQAQNQIEKTISNLIFRGLFKYDIYGATIPDLADTWTVSDDGLTYTIRIKDNQRWTNGKKITADDLIYTSYKSSDLSGVATDKIDDLTVRYTLPNKYAPFLSLLTIDVLPVDSEERMNPLFPISSADFRVAKVEKRGSFVSGVVLVTTKSEYSIKKLVFKFYPNEDELNTAAKLGEIEGFMSDSNCCSSLENFADYKFPIQGIYYALYFNLRNEKFQDITFRRKLEAVLPIKDMIVDRGITVQGPISRSAFTDRALQFDKYDKTVSDSIADTIVEIKVPNDSSHVKFVEQIKSIWEDQLGIRVIIVKEPAEDFVNKVIVPRDFEILFYGQEIGRDPDRYVLWHSAQSNAPGLNLSGFTHIRSDRALEEGRNELDNEIRKIHYNEFQKVINEQVPLIFLYHPNEHYYVSKRISGIGQKYTFTYWDRFLDLKNWKITGTN